MAGTRKEAVVAVSIYATFPDMKSAEAIGEALVRDGLAACANLVPGMRSIYRWQGKIERAEEVVAFIKTTAAQADAVIAAIEAGHPYDTPAVLVLPIMKGSGRYLEWIAEETGGG